MHRVAPQSGILECQSICNDLSCSNFLLRLHIYFYFYMTLSISNGLTPAGEGTGLADDGCIHSQTCMVDLSSTTDQAGLREDYATTELIDRLTMGDTLICLLYLRFI